MPDPLNDLADRAQPPGLSQDEAAKRLKHDGPNELTAARQRTLWHIVLEVAREPMVQLLLGAGLLYLLIGSLGEALMLLAFVAVTVTITIVQEQRTEHALESLRDLTSPRALVLRGGERLRIPGREVVRGDLLVLIEGDRVAADARVLQASDLLADESLLTGEAVPLAKEAAPADLAQSEDAWPDRGEPGNVPPVGDPAATNAARPGGATMSDAPAPQAISGPGMQASAMRPGGAGGACHVFAGTMLVGGQGLARVTAVGLHSEIGRIGKALDEIAPPVTPLTLQTRRLVRIFSIIGLGLSAVVVLLYGLTRGDWTAGLLAGITLAMSMLPEEFVLILTVFMAMGAWRMSHERVLTRRAATIEALGAATVLCTDKTGTLTCNQMTITELALVGGAAQSLAEPFPQPLPEAWHELVEVGLLASELAPFDPMDKAFVALADRALPAARRHADWQLEHEYGLAPDLAVMTHVWRLPGSTRRMVALKGAHEAVASLCRLDPAQAQALSASAQAMAARGLRVLAVARASLDGTEHIDTWPASPRDFTVSLVGLVGLADPLRPGVPAAVQQCRDAGIRVVMITGDHPVTACAIAAQAGLIEQQGPGGLDAAAELDHKVLSGSDLASLDDAQLRQRVATVTVYARVLPEQKLRIVEALKACGEVVAMTGDGVNDAPSLKAAHIGIAMGQRGTDVAREAASLVLLDDEFGAVVTAVRLGRRIYDNLRKAMAFAFAVHVPIAGLSLLPLLLGLPLVFSPVHIAFLELIINPVCSIVFESEVEEGDVMHRPPRDPALPLFSRSLIVTSLLQGALVLGAVAALFIGLLRFDVPEAQARAVTFSALVLCCLVLIIANRNFTGRLLTALRRPNPALWRVVASTGLMLAAVLYIAPLRSLFNFELPTPVLMGLAAATGLGVLLLLEAAKPLALRLQRGLDPAPAPR